MKTDFGVFGRHLRVRTYALELFLLVMVLFLAVIADSAIAADAGKPVPLATGRLSSSLLGDTDGPAIRVLSTTPQLLNSPTATGSAEASGESETVGSSGSVSASQVGMAYDNQKDLYSRPQYGSVSDGDSDRYWMYMNQGQRVDLSLQWGSEDVDLDMYLYDGDGTTQGSSSSGSGVAESISYTAPAPGWYEVAVSAYSGSSDYILQWPMALANYDDDFPGLVISSPSTTGWFDATDGIDVYRVTVPAGKYIDITLTRPSGFDWDVYLFKPGTVSCSALGYNNSNVVSYPTGSAVSRRVLSPATTAGTYYVVVWNGDSRSGSYGLSYHLLDSVSSWTNISAPSSIPYNGSVKISGAVGVGGSRRPGVRVFLYRNGGSSSVKNTVTNSNGDFAFWEKPTRKTSYVVKYWSTDPSVRSSVSKSVSVAPKVYLSAPRMSTYLSSESSYKVTGFMKPRHARGTRPIRIKAYRLESSKWVLRKQAYGTVANYSSYSAFTGRIRLPYAGKWKVATYAPADSRHAASWASSTKRVIVNRTTHSISGAGTYIYGKAATFSGILRNRLGNPLAYRTVYLQESWDGNYWTTIRKLKSNSKGKVSVSRRPNSTRYYRFQYRGSNTQAPCNSRRAKMFLSPLVVSGKVGSSGSSSKWVTLPEGYSVAKIEKFPSAAYYNMYLYNSAGELVSRIETYGNCTWGFSAEKAGRFNLRVNAYEGAPYRLTIQ